MATGRYGKRMVSLTTMLLLFCTVVWGQTVEFTAGAPQMVEVGVPFRVEFTANAEVDEFTPPAFAGVNIIAGPSTSFGRNITFVNGKQIQTVTNSFTYVLTIDQEGQVTIPGAAIKVKGETYTSKPVIIEAVAGGGQPSGQPSQGTQGNQGGQQPSASSGAIASDDILIRIIPSKTTVYKGEPLRVSFKLYSRHELNTISNIKYPAFNGFWSHELQVNDQGGQENYNGKLYSTLVIREFLLFPQQSGTLTIDQFSMTVSAVIVAQSRPQTIFDEFFGGGPQIQEVPKNLAAGPLNITVKDLPAGAPAGFNGAVGRFTMEGGPSQIEIPANSAANYDIKISGTGNLPLINAPAVEMPSSFEQYTVKSTDGYNVSGTTFSGSRTFSVPFIARAEGQYTISPVEFSYFDPQTETYKTLRTPNYTLQIGADTGAGATSTGIVSGINKEELKILGEDVRFIRLGDPKLERIGSVFLWSWGFWLTLLVLIAVFIGLMVYLQKRIKFRSNTTLVRNKRAQKIALKRLKTAERYMLAKDGAKFYDEMLKALWGYMSDKLNIPVAHLSRDNVREGLFAKGVEPELIERYVETIAECEYAQYAPSDKTQIGDVYNAAVDLISRMESKI